MRTLGAPCKHLLAAFVLMHVLPHVDMSGRIKLQRDIGVPQLPGWSTARTGVDEPRGAADQAP